MKNRFKRAFRLDRASKPDARRSVSDELSHHLDLMTEELIDEGWDAAEARREAVRRFGDVDDTRSYCEDMQTRRGREARRREMMSIDELVQDTKYALRSVKNAPGYGALVVLTLAFGIAANTTIFSVMNPYIFRPLPFEAPEELVQVNQVNPTTGWDMDRFSWPQYVDWTERSRAFQDVAAYVYGSANVTDQEGPEQIQYSALSANMFDVLGAQAMFGRTFRPEEGIPGGEAVVVMAHGLWERRYASDPSTVGRTITMDGTTRTVVGVMPPDFNFPFGSARLWVPIQETAAGADRTRMAYQLIGRLNPEWTAERAHAELEQIQSELSASFPDIDGRMAGVTVKPLREALNFAWTELNLLFVTLLGAVGFVLLIACANVASLTLARGSSRIREVSVRAAMGARRGRIVRQLLTESLLLSLAGGVAGVALSWWMTSMLNPVIPEDLFKIGAISIDRVVLAFSLVVTLATPLAFGLLPALRASNVDLTGGLKEGSKGSGGLSTSRARSALVVAQVALAVVLTTGAGLMLRSFASVQSLDLGFDAERVVTAEVVLGADAYPSGEERLAFMHEAVTTLSTLPEVLNASATSWLPLNHETMSAQVIASSMAGTPGDEWPLAVSNLVLPDYFETMSIEIVAGREFGLADGSESERVVIVNRDLAERFWPDGRAVGQTLLVGDPSDPVQASVIGVVSDVKHSDLDPGQVGPQIYRPAAQSPTRRFFVLARTAQEPTALVPAVREAMSSIAPNLPLTIRPMPDVVAENQLQWSLSALFLGIFGGGALLLAMLGIYGLISFSVAQRTREIGVRIALGASTSEIRRNVVGDGMRLTGIGIAVGIAISLGVGRLISSMLYGVSAFDPLTLTAVLALFSAVAAMASFVPAARASRTDPIEVLRAE